MRNVVSHWNALPSQVREGVANSAALAAAAWAVVGFGVVAWLGAGQWSDSLNEKAARHARHCRQFRLYGACRTVAPELMRSWQDRRRMPDGRFELLPLGRAARNAAARNWGGARGGLDGRSCSEVQP